MLQATPSLAERIENLVDACLPASKDVPDDWGLWFDLWAQAFRHPEVKKDRAELDQQWRDLITRVVQAGVDARRDREGRRRGVHVMWTALLDGLVVQVALEDPLVDVATGQADRAGRRGQGARAVVRPSAGRGTAAATPATSSAP